jgi:hypothetical protein
MMAIEVDPSSIISNHWTFHESGGKFLKRAWNSTYSDVMH